MIFRDQAKITISVFHLAKKKRFQWSEIQLKPLLGYVTLILFMI